MPESDLFVIIILFILAIPICFLPTFIAYRRQHPYRHAIFLLNFLTGATGVGYVAAFIWACLDDNVVKFGEKPTIAKELKELAQLKEQGIITEEEFETKKNNLLNS